MNVESMKKTSHMAQYILTYLSLHSDQTLFYNIKGESCSEPVKIIINQSFF